MHDSGTCKSECTSNRQSLCCPRSALQTDLSWGQEPGMQLPVIHDPLDILGRVIPSLMRVQIPQLSWRLEAGGWRLGAGDWRVEAGDWGLEAGDWRVEGGGWRLGTGGWRLPARAGGWRLEARGWTLEGGGWRLHIRWEVMQLCSQTRVPKLGIAGLYLRGRQQSVCIGKIIKSLLPKWEPLSP